MIFCSIVSSSTGGIAPSTGGITGGIAPSTGGITSGIAPSTGGILLVSPSRLSRLYGIVTVIALSENLKASFPYSSMILGTPRPDFSLM